MTELPPALLLQEDADIVASQCVNCITEFIDLLREAFAPPTRALQPSTSDQENDAVRLFSILAMKKSFVERVTEIHSKALKLYQTNDSIQDAVPWFLPLKRNHEATPSSSERSNLLLHILLPLVKSLGYCYECLDRMVVPPQLPSKPRREHQKPPPPVGMLSLKNYTDIACLVEFIICTSVLPFLPPNVLAPITERVRYQLPKSLAGHIPRSSLLWVSSEQESLSSPEDEFAKPPLIKEWDAVVSVLGRFLLLDRFRPMLLPRHVCDIMAVIVYIETNHKPPCFNTSSSYLSVIGRWMDDTKPSSMLVLDSYWQAKAFQGLLRKGRDAPSWLRSAISQRLTSLATRDLLVIVTVFVHEAIDQDYSSAALRLAGALISKNKSERESLNETERDDYFCAICDQLFEVLDSIPLMTRNAICPKDASSIETVWAVLNLLPNRIITGYLFENVIQNDVLLPVADNDDAVFYSKVSRIIARFCNLFSLPPSATNNSIAATICSLLFKPIKLSHLKNSDDERSSPLPALTAIGAIVRLAATPCVEKSTDKDDAILLLRLFIGIMTTVIFSNGTDLCDNVPGVDVLNVVILQSLAPCAWDINGLTFDLQSPNGGSSARFEPLLIRRAPPDGSPMLNRFVGGVDARANLIVRQVLLQEVKRDDSIHDNELVFLFFQTLLTLYFSGHRLKNSSTDHSMLLYSESFRLVSMVCMPLLCDVCSPETLISCNCDTTSNTDILDIVKIVLDGALSHFPHMETMNSLQSSGNVCQSLGPMAHRLIRAEQFLLSTFPVDAMVVQRSLFEIDRFVGPDDEMILSVTAVVLGLLISILELGSKTRSRPDEQVLQSMSPGLLRLADPYVLSRNSDASLLSAHSQIAEMASFAAALIASRSMVADSDILVNDEKESSLGYFGEAENALRSDLPPLRARAMVLLRNRANAISEREKPVENLDDTQIHLKELYKILELSVEVLKDTESYVYLAAIHTIVAVTDANPSRMVPIIGITVATGELEMDGIDKIKLCLAQRSKMTEALIFIIRRSGAFYEHLPFLMRLLVVGLRSDSMHQLISAEEARDIQETTHNYFVTDLELSPLEDESEHHHSRKDYWNELDIRVRTGGPLFETEEGEVVRSAMVMVVSELLVVLSPSVTARYSAHLVDCCIDMLRLEASRPVRRAGAALSRELYGALVREQIELMEAISSSKPFDVRLSRSMVEGRETVLHSVLQGIVSQGDGTLEDPATMARCREALQLREDASEGGILLAGKVSLESQQQCEEHPIARLLKDNQLKTRPPMFFGIKEL